MTEIKNDEIKVNIKYLDNVCPAPKTFRVMAGYRVYNAGRADLSLPSRLFCGLLVQLNILTQNIPARGP